jgi:hypothetical protein
MNSTKFKKCALIVVFLLLIKISPVRAQSSGELNGALAVGPLQSGTDYGATAGGITATAFGYSATAIGYGSIAIGYNATAARDNGVAIGFDATASGDASLSLGFANTASGNYSTAFGWANFANGNFSTASGYLTTASADYSCVIGVYNVGGGTPGNPLPADPIFEVGNGNPLGYPTGTGASDALVIYRNGNAVLQGTLSVAPGGDIPMFSGN